MKFLLSLIAASSFLFFLPKTAHAEASQRVSLNTQADAFAALQELENSLLGSLIWSTPIGGGRCKPKLSIGFFNLSLLYDPSETCPLVGKVVIGFFPLSAEVDLDVNNLQNVDRIQMKTRISVRYAQSTGLQLGLHFTEGRITLRQSANSPLFDMMINGSVAMRFTKDNHSIQARKNIFSSATGAGFALITDVSKQPPVRRFEGCVLAGGSASDVNAGTLTQCAALFR